MEFYSKRTNSQCQAPVVVPRALEVCWGILRPTKATSNPLKIILCCFYSPPNSKQKSALIDHIQLEYNRLVKEHPNAFAVITGDKNDLNAKKILKINPRFKQIVDVPTRKAKTLDVVFSDIWNMFEKPTTIPPIAPDKDDIGSPSDHLGVLVTPINNWSNSERTAKVIKFRTFPDSQIREFGRRIVQENWKMLEEKLDPTELVDRFERISGTMVEKYLPMKEMKVTSDDKPWINSRLKQLKRQRQRIYRRQGRSKKYLQLKETFNQEKKRAIKVFKEKIEKEVKDGKRASAYKTIRRLDPLYENKQEYCIQSHQDEGLPPQESVERIAKYFIAISEEHEELELEKLPPNVKEEIAKQYEVPIIGDYQVYNKIKQAKKPKTGVNGGIPKKLVEEFSVELFRPAAILMNRITETGIYPRQWVREYQTAIAKQYPPASEDQIRLISCTNFLSKAYEAFIKDWLMPYISPHLDTANFGGLKNSSTPHYLLSLLHFIHEELDHREPHAVLLAQIDALKAFNNVSHVLVIQDLFDMSVPGWILKILVSFLTKRNMTLRFNGIESSRYFLPASAPQGIYLGVIIFLVKFNGAFLRPPIPRNLLNDGNMPGKVMSCHDKEFTAKYVDDSVKSVSINLKNCLEPAVDLVHPVTYHERTGHQLKYDHNPLQGHLNDFKGFMDKNEFKVNVKKSSVMIFNFSKKYDFFPGFTLGEESEELNIVKSTKVLGIMLSDSLRWDEHIKHICGKAASRIWALRRLMQLELNFETILDVYCKEIRSILEYGAVVFHSSLTKKQSNAIEKIQKIVLRMLGQYLNIKLSYSEATIFFCIEELFSRRIELCKTFIKRNLNNPRFNHLFGKTSHSHNVRPKTRKIQKNQTRTNRFYSSPLVFLRRLANKK